MAAGVAVADPPAAFPATAIAGTIHQAAPSEFACPKCRSEDVRKLSMIWRDGLSAVDTRTSGIGVAGGGLGAGAARTQGTSQTLSSIGAAPPETKPIMWPVIAVVFGFIMLFSGSSGSALVGLLFLGIGGWLAYQRTQFNNNVYPDLRRRWENSFRCSRCENVFVAGV